MLTLLFAAPLLAGVLAAAHAASAGALGFSPCVNGSGFACATLTVPLDRGGLVPGTIPLSVEGLQAGRAPSQDAVLALAGGPGQPALPLAESIAKAISPALGTRDLLVFDQRGTGTSAPLSCPAFENPAGASSLAALLEQCALGIGPARGLYTTQESVEDIEAIRRSGGYEKLVLYGVSYGTKVAIEYAERYPQRVEALVLDSVVPPEGPDPFELPTFAALAPVLDELCSARACAQITSNPLRDVGHLAAALHKRALKGSAYDGSGHRHSSSLNEVELLGILEAGDLNPALRALLPAAVVSALHRDPDPLLRLNLLSEGLIPNLPGAPGLTASGHSPARRLRGARPVALGSSGGVNEALFVDTTCEESLFPWQRTDPPATRLSEALTALHALPRSDFYPFHASTALSSGAIPGCLQWPDASPPPAALVALPNVPTLILSGAQDLRTPTSSAQRIAARIADAQLKVVPYTGHSVLGTDFSGCAQAAVREFFAGALVAPCGPTADLFRPTPITPNGLDRVKSISGIRGRPGRTLTAALDTILDLKRQVIGAILQANQELPSGSSFGGLRGGYARLSSSAVRLSRFSYVSGVQLTGAFAIKNGKLEPATVRIGGSSASPGTVLIGSGSRVRGTLGGVHFNLSIAKVKLADTSAALAQPYAGPESFPLPGLARVP